MYTDWGYFTKKKIPFGEYLLLLITFEARDEISVQLFQLTLVMEKTLLRQVSFVIRAQTQETRETRTEFKLG